MKIICLKFTSKLQTTNYSDFLIQVKHAEEMKTFNLVLENSYPQRIPVVDPLHACVCSVTSNSL